MDARQQFSVKLFFLQIHNPERYEEAKLLLNALRKEADKLALRTCDIPFRDVKVVPSSVKARIISVEAESLLKSLEIIDISVAKILLCPNTSEPMVYCGEFFHVYRKVRDLIFAHHGATETEPSQENADVMALESSDTLFSKIGNSIKSIFKTLY